MLTQEDNKKTGLQKEPRRKQRLSEDRYPKDNIPTQWTTYGPRGQHTYPADKIQTLRATYLSRG
jgi:hypothetical protein